MPTIPPFDPQSLQRLAADMAASRDRDHLTAAQVQDLATRWRPHVNPPASEEELFDLVSAADRPSRVAAPRWLCHLLGLCHRAVHLVLRTPQNLLVFQVRSRHKLDWPGALDLAVTGHVGAGQSWEQALFRETAEELGLDLAATALLAPPGLQLTGPAYYHRDSDSLNPPVNVCHVVRIYAATLTPAGLAAIHFADGEVNALHLCRPEEALRLLADEPHCLAPGLKQSLPRYLELAGHHGI